MLKDGNGWNVCACVCVSILHLPAKHVITLASAKVCLPRLCPTRARHSITLLYIAQKRIASKSKNRSVSSVGTLLMQCGNVWPDYHKFSWEYAAKRSRDTSVCVWMPTKSPCAGDIRGRNSGWLHCHCHDLPRLCQTVAGWLLKRRMLQFLFATVVSSFELGRVM